MDKWIEMMRELLGEQGWDDLVRSGQLPGELPCEKTGEIPCQEWHRTGKCPAGGVDGCVAINAIASAS